MPKARKLLELINYSIPLDNANGWSTKKNLIGINLNSKILMKSKNYWWIKPII